MQEDNISMQEDTNEAYLCWRHTTIGAVLYQFFMSYQANLELVIVWIRYIPVEEMRWQWIYENSYIWTAEERMNKWIRNCLSCEYNCDDHLLIHSFFRSLNVWIFMYSLPLWNFFCNFVCTFFYFYFIWHKSGAKAPPAPPPARALMQAYTRICLFNSKWKVEKEKYPKYIIRAEFYKFLTSQLLMRSLITIQQRSENGYGF